MKTNEVKRIEKEVKIIGITKPGTLVKIAKNNNINLEDTYVTLKCALANDQSKKFTCSQKLRYLGKTDYQLLINAIETKETVLLQLTKFKSENSDRPNYFFNLIENISIDDLFDQVNNLSEQYDNSIIEQDSSNAIHSKLLAVMKGI